ncbi:MAG: hypothetical protein NVSMB18_31440 [Acetobacteraceae bacterium]
MRLLYGMERLPRSLDLNDKRLPAVELGSAPLRLNSEPVPAAVLESAGEGHAARVAALTAWLQSLAGDYAVARRGFVAGYMDVLAAEVDRHRAALTAGLARYDGLYAPEDWIWSALRPLPRAWLDGERIDVAFWDGTAVIAVRLEQGAAIPDQCRGFWRGEVLPRSPFRRPRLAL